jgi:hypothetical protein
MLTVTVTTRIRNDDDKTLFITEHSAEVRPIDQTALFASVVTPMEKTLGDLHRKYCPSAGEELPPDAYTTLPTNPVTT